jgi:hypothetical protein
MPPKCLPSLLTILTRETGKVKGEIGYKITVGRAGRYIEAK